MAILHPQDTRTVTEIRDDGSLVERVAYLFEGRALVSVHPDDLETFAAVRRDAPGLVGAAVVDADGVAWRVDAEPIRDRDPDAFDAAAACLAALAAREWGGPWLAHSPVPPALIEEN